MRKSWPSADAFVRVSWHAAATSTTDASRSAAVARNTSSADSRCGATTTVAPGVMIPAFCAAISAIVSAVKTYARVDEMPVQDVDVHESLENTLVILKHKLQGIRAVREFPRSRSRRGGRIRQSAEQPLPLSTCPPYPQRGSPPPAPLLLSSPCRPELPSPHPCPA